MEEPRDFDSKWNNRSHSRSKVPPEDLKESLEVISFSYGSKSPKNNKPTKKNASEKPHDREEAVEGSSSPNRQTTTQYYLDKGKTSPNAVEEKRGLSDWFLTGRGLQEPLFKLDTHKRSHSLAEPIGAFATNSERRFCIGLNTYPPSMQKCTHPDHTYLNTDDQHFEERSRARPLSTRPLGEPWSAYNDSHRARQRASSQRITVSDVMDKEALQTLPRMMSSPGSLSRPRSLNELKRAYSSSNSTKYSRSRSVSLPAQTKFECHVVTDWEERKTNGVTYVTPYLKKSFSDK